MKTFIPSQQFHQSQFGYWIIALIAFSVLIPLALFNPESPHWMVFIYPLFAIPFCLLFYRMTVTLDDERIVIRFGIGLIKKVIPFSNIQSCQTGRSSYWHGWGIRFLGNGTLYNIWGLQVVKLKLKDRTSEIWIGSPDNEALSKAIQDRMEKA